MAFHSPERYRLTREVCRREGFPMSMADQPKTWGNDGYFFIPRGKGNRPLAVIASDMYGWEHVSVHAITQATPKGSIPNWEEMCLVKWLWWGDDVWVMQLHPPASDYVNDHPTTLHLWRPKEETGQIVTPPYFLVGRKAGQSVRQVYDDAIKATGGKG